MIIQIQSLIKRVLFVLLFVTMIPVLTSCGDYGDEFGIDYGHSNIYTDEEIQNAVDTLLQIFSGFNGCEMHNLRYLGDNYSMDEYFDMMDKMYPDNDYEQIIVFTSDFHTPPGEDDNNWWIPDHEYRDFRWVLARSGNERWEIINYGEDCLDV